MNLAPNASTSSRAGTDPLLEFAGIGKSFFGAPVLKNISFGVGVGQTIGLVGENGAGKSTLMNILGGNLFPDTGQMRLQGQSYAPGSPRDAERAGVAFIHQELNLFPNLSIAENIFISAYPRRVRWVPWIHRRSLRERTRQLLAEVNLPLDPDMPVERLSAGERQLVEVAKALSSDARLILFDEPTTSLSSAETTRLFHILERLRNRGVSMIYISHNLDHVLEQSHEVVVLRDGRVVGHGSRNEFTVDQLVSLMVGREITQFFPRRETTPDRSEPPILEVRDVFQPGIVRRVSFELRKGEVLGISGLMGSGRSELARILFGLDPCASGEIRLEGQEISRLAPRERIRRGLAYLTEDRRGDGLCLEATIGENISLAALAQFAQRFSRLLDRQATTAAVSRIREAVKLTPSARDAQPVKTLSGGNQQKVVLAKWLLNRPNVFILDEPTRGIDVGAKYEIYRLINELAARGAGVLMISSEVEELIGMCDRILVMSRGAIRDTIEPAGFDRERILRAALHGGGLP